MRPGLRECIEPLGADGGTVGADAGGQTRSGALNWPNSLEFVCLETLCAPKRTDSMYSGHAGGWDRPPVDPLNAHSPWHRVSMEAFGDLVTYCPLTYLPGVLNSGQATAPIGAGR